MIWTLYLCPQGCNDQWLFFEANSGLQAKEVWETLLYEQCLNVSVNYSPLLVADICLSMSS